jgi:hypothetical protein
LGSRKRHVLYGSKKLGLSSTKSFFSNRNAISVSIGCSHTRSSAQEGNSKNLLNRLQLIKTRKKAIRAGVWFKALRRIDRVLIDLTIKVAENVRSALLAKSVLTVMSKLEGLLESNSLRLIRAYGLPSAEKLSLIGQKWGNSSAAKWATEPAFAFFLGVMSLRT